MNLRSALLPLCAAVLVSGVLGVQVASGGGDFVPARAANPCAARVVTPVSRGIDALGERLVLLGLDGAACRLGISREALALQLATPGRRSAAQVAAVRSGLLAAVERIKHDGDLPSAADLSDEALANADLPSFVKFLIRALPDRLVNSALKTDDVLRRAINGIDLRAVLAELTDPDQLTSRINDAVKQAVKDSLVDRLRHLVH